MSEREILMVGSVPLKPASNVFTTVCGCIGHMLRRVPDGEQAGWVEAVRPKIGQHRAFEPSQISRIGNEKTFGFPIQMYRLKPGYHAVEIDFDDLEIAKNAIDSYCTFRDMKSTGKIPSNLKFQVTIPGPATSGGTLQLPEDELLPLMERTLLKEINKVVAAIPHTELTIQIDLAVEVEKEEYDRRPHDFDTPVFGIRKFTLDGTTSSVARLADSIPTGVELGFHLCAMWHVYKDAGQDLAVHVDYANLLAHKLRHPIAYIHIPTTPEFDEAAFGPLRRLKLSPATKLFLGLLHTVDGVDGARKRITAAQKHYSEFGIGNFCGLSQWNAGPETVLPMLELHRAAARL